jgi:hypothetical protein
MYLNENALNLRLLGIVTKVKLLDKLAGLLNLIEE